MRRGYWLVAPAFLLIAIFAACSGDEEGGGNGSGNGDGGPATSSSPIIAPPQFTIDEALAALTEIERLIREPDAGQVAQVGIAQSAIDLRVRDAFEGVPNTAGLVEVRRLLEAGPEGEDDNRILAGETLYNITQAAIIPPFGASDVDAVPPEEIAELDPLHAWAVDFEDGLPTTAIWKNAVAKIIFLWYRL